MKRFSAIEQRLGWLLEDAGYTFEREHRFHSTRKWRFDFADPANKIAIECEGGIWVNGAHNRGKHFTSDCEKYNAAAVMGWKVLRFTADMVNKGQALTTIKEALSR